MNFSLVQPYQPGEFLQVSSSDRTLCVTKDPKGQALPEILEKLPSTVHAIATLPCNTPDSIEERLHFHDRVVHLGKQIAEHNEKIDKNLWITLIHVLLFICTFGYFSFRESLKLQQPEFPLTSLFPSQFDWSRLTQLLTKEQWKELPKELFFLLVSHTPLEIFESLSPNEPSETFNLIDFQKLYLKWDPNLENIVQLSSRPIRFLKCLLQLSFKRTPSPTEGVIICSPVQKNIGNLSSESLDRLLSWYDESLSAYATPSQMRGLPLKSLLRLHKDLRFSEDPSFPSPLRGAIKEEISYFPADELGPHLSPDSIHLVTQKQWEEATTPTFLLFTQSTWKKDTCWDNLSVLIVPVELQIDDQLFCSLYLKHDPTLSLLPGLAFGKNGGGAALLKRLTPLEPLLPQLKEQDTNRD